MYDPSPINIQTIFLCLQTYQLVVGLLLHPAAGVPPQQELTSLVEDKD